MPFSSERLLRELDQPKIIDWALELKNHKESVAFLKEAVKGEHLNPNQFRNALHALYRLAFPEDTADVLQVFVDLAGHPKREIRSQAVQLAIAILRVLKDLGTPFQLSVAQERALRSALALGVNANVSRVARRFFDLQERNS